MNYRVLLVSFLLSITSSSFAQTAKELYEVGVQLRKDGKSKEALNGLKGLLHLSPITPMRTMKCAGARMKQKIIPGQFNL